MRRVFIVIIFIVIAPVVTILYSAVIHLGIKAVFCHKLAVIALFDYLSVVHNQNHIGVSYGREPVRNDKTRPALHHFFECALNPYLGSGID